MIHRFLLQWYRRTISDLHASNDVRVTTGGDTRTTSASKTRVVR